MSEKDTEHVNEHAKDHENTYHDEHIHHYYHKVDDGREAAHRKQLEKKRNTVTILAFSLAIIGLLLFAMINGEKISKWFGDLTDILMPVILGGVIAYIANPLLKLLERKVFFKIKKQGLKRALSLTCTLLFFILLIVGLAFLVIPEIVKSIEELLANYNSYIESTTDYINGLIGKFIDHPEDSPILNSEQVKKSIISFFTNTEGILEWAQSEIPSFLGGLVSGISDFIIGFFIAIYLLASKEKRIAQVSRAIKATFSKKHTDFISNTVKLIDNSFGGFIEAKLINAAIIWAVCLLMFNILDIPYPILIATIVGVTDIIPVFGPFIGAIPSIFIIFVSDPSKVLIFIILCIVIQQIDGNIIGPKLLGENTGVSSLCVIIAITIMGSYWGIFGMLIGVPLFAVFINLAETYIVYKLKKKNMPTELEAYYLDGQAISASKTQRPLNMMLRKATSIFKKKKNNSLDNDTNFKDPEIENEEDQTYSKK